MNSKQKNLRLPQATIEQIEWLAKRYATQGGAVAVAVRLLYDAEKSAEKADGE